MLKIDISGKQTISVFQLTAVFSMLFALVGFSYNVWRMEITEYNSNVRSASFELLLQLSELESIVYAAHYDKDLILGNPRKGWVKVNLIADLSMITEPELSIAAEELKQSWQSNWELLANDEASAQAVVSKIDDTRARVRQLLKRLD
ncbi:conserved hypothetical protein [Shewanella halifaxensis HAW-EB4]|uniref:Uncharacterized protein n=1 Tax=Shewanella halifaxensis (strain HAW-EB4) TaxID=458817 RepID=B0TNF4_SHEHH|nr:hypothetical protein [Shewanella halifaxensis]ABZ77468.1 conserved hypothetical protein [Shewanella halifaxensis HAW-EB4]